MENISQKKQLKYSRKTTPARIFEKTIPVFRVSNEVRVVEFNIRKPMIQIIN
jgi:hypothetical protein